MHSHYAHSIQIRIAYAMFSIWKWPNDLFEWNETQWPNGTLWNLHARKMFRTILFLNTIKRTIFVVRLVIWLVKWIIWNRWWWLRLYNTAITIPSFDLFTGLMVPPPPLLCIQISNDPMENAHFTTLNTLNGKRLVRLVKTRKMNNKIIITRETHFQTIMNYAGP